MNLKEKALEKLGSIFANYEVRLIDVNDYRLIFRSNKLYMYIIYNPRENSICFMFTRMIDRNFVVLTNRFLQDYFKSDIDVDVKNIDIFLDRLANFLILYGNKLLSGEDSFLDHLFEYSRRKNAEYTDKFRKKTI